MEALDGKMVLGKNGPETTVRTALEDLQVLAVNPTGEGTSQGTILPSVTLLAGPAQADVLAAADSGARVRLTLPLQLFSTAMQSPRPSRVRARGHSLGRVENVSPAVR